MRLRHGERGKEVEEGENTIIRAMQAFALHVDSLPAAGGLLFVLLSSCFLERIPDIDSNHETNMQFRQLRRERPTDREAASRHTRSKHGTM
jgi:hypothetical protein